MPTVASDPAGVDSPAVATVVWPREPIDLDLTLGPLRRGRGDPSCRVEPGGAWWKATRTPDGPATLVLEPCDDRIEARAWGPGAHSILDGLPDLLGCNDGAANFDPPAGPIRDLWRRFPGLRITRTRRVFEALLPSIVEQKVTRIEARDAYHRILRRWGEPAPGPRDLRLVLPPDPRVLARTPYWELHAEGVERRRAVTLTTIASRAGALESLASLPAAEARRKMTALPGIGPWTAAEVALVAFGDADAVPVGDYHLPNIVAWTLAGEPRADDERMLELLEPFAGHRGLVVRLLQAGGVHAPRFGPRMPLRELRRI